MTHIDLNSGPVNAYLQRTVRLWLGLKEDQAVEIPMMPDYLRNLLLRTEEYTNKHRDQWGEWEHPFSLNYQEGKLWIPEVDCWTAGIRQELSQNGLVLEPLWPDDHHFTVCLTHDVDVVSEQTTAAQRLREIKKHLEDKAGPARRKPAGRILSAIRPLARGVLRRSHRFPSVQRTLEVVLAIERELGVVSSFFFTAYPVAKRSQYDCDYSLHDSCSFRGRNTTVLDMMKIMAQEGFDIGLHGSFYSATDVDMLAEQKKMIEDAIGAEVVTTRQHWLNWNVGVTPRCQSRAGLLADSTLGFNRNIGFRSGTGLPYRLFDLVNQETISLLEVPLIIQDGSLISNNGLEYDFDLARDVMAKLIDRVAAVNGCMTIVFHPHNFLDELYEQLYRWLIAYCIEKGAWMTSLRGVLDWWTEREGALGE